MARRTEVYEGNLFAVVIEVILYFLPTSLESLYTIVLLPPFSREIFSSFFLSKNKRLFFVVFVCWFLIEKWNILHTLRKATRKA